jgi:NADP-dependent 3-hydroxy acid dehydrogenase YdfG
MAISQDIPRDDSNTKVWLITGTSSGMGRALVKSALERNDKVIATARVLEQIQDLRSFADSSRLHLMQLDITDSQNIIDSKVNEAIGVWGRIDVLVNNAGTGVKMILEEGGCVSRSAHALNHPATTFLFFFLASKE